MPLKVQMDLLNDLKRFGLDPRDWIFQSETPRRVRIQHRRDPDFQLRGLIEKRREKLGWRELELQSL
jgi:hypothetical protein